MTRTEPLTWDPETELWFQRTPVKDGEIRTFRLPRGIEGSLAQSPRTYGWREGLWELAFFNPDGSMHGDVSGWLTLADAAKLIRRENALLQGGLAGFAGLTPEEDANELATALQDLLTRKLPYVNASVSTLGGPQRPSVLIRFSADPPSSWKRNILQNSRWGLLHVTFGNSQYEIHSGKYGNGLPLLRAAKVTTQDAVLKKIQAWLDKVEV